MAQPWESDDCEDVRAYHTHYPIPVAAALWCSVPPDRVNSILSQCADVGRAVMAHPKVPCIEPRCRAMHEAIEAGALECRREGRKVAPDDHVAPERRTVSREALKTWIAQAFPSSKPAFLFDAVERSTHASINADSFRALQADRDALSARLEKAKSEFKSLRTQKDDLERENQALRKIADAIATPGERAETTYLNIVGALLDVALRSSPGGQPYSSFKNQAAIISVVLAHHEDKPGISARTLEDKFARANESLRQN